MTVAHFAYLAALVLLVGCPDEVDEAVRSTRSRSRVRRRGPSSVELKIACMRALGQLAPRPL